MPRLAGSVVVLAVLLVAPAEAVTKDVQVGTGNSFSPSKVVVKTGGSVHWLRSDSGNSHNVSADGGLFRSGAPTTGSIDYTVTFSAGSYPYQCEIHGPGMSGIVRVPPKVTKAPAGKPFTVAWATSTSETGDTYKVRYRVGSGKWKIWKGGTGALKGIFGKNGKPVRVRSGKTYSFGAKSTGGGSSRWSPKKSFTA